MRLPWAQRRELRTLAAGFALLAIGLLVVAARPADRVVALNEALLQAPVATITPQAAACQPETIPAEARRVRIPGPALKPGAVRARTVVDAGGSRAEGAWVPSGDGALVMPLPPGTRAGAADMCIETDGPAEVWGAPTGEPDRLRLGTGTGAGRMRVAYLYGTGPQPLWGDTLPRLPERIAAANGSAWAPWTVGLGILIALAGLILLFRPGGSRREIVAVAVLTFGSAATWSGITPMMQSSDELSHAAYVQVFAELGHPPRDRSNSGEVPEEMACWATVTRLQLARHYQTERPPWRRSGEDPCAGMNRKKDAAQYQAAQPPAYYAMAMLGYRTAAVLDRPLPDRLLLARLISALLAALTVVGSFLLVREAFPASPWPARAGALAAGLQPVMMFNHGVINSDALVFATTAAIAAVLARTWRRGPTLRRALLLGALIGLGLLAKITFILVVPIAIAVQLFTHLRRRELPLRRRLGLVAAGWGTALVPALAYLFLGSAIWEPDAQEEAHISPPTAVGKLRLASYVWQAFLPPLPFMEDEFPGRRPPAMYVLLNGTTSRLGWWDDYGIGGPWSTLLIVGCVALVGFAVVAAARRRAWRLPLAVAAAVAAAYTALLIAALFLPNDFQVQGRYMATLTPLWALAAGTAVAALRPRWQPHAGAVLAVGMAGWTGLALAATVGRWYL